MTGRVIVEAMETPPAYDFSLPVEPGCRLSLAALESVKGRTETFSQRDQRMCDVEFKA